MRTRRSCGAGGGAARAGGELDPLAQAWARRGRPGGAFVNDGAAVLDRATHLGNLPADSGTPGPGWRGRRGGWRGGRDLAATCSRPSAR